MTSPTAPLAERLDFWKFQHASITFEEVKKLCALIVQQKIESNHPLHLPLMVALHALYARPFKQKKAVRLSDDIVPKELRQTHDSLIEMRDQIHAHYDFDGPATTSGLRLNKVAVFLHGTQARFAITPVFPRSKQVVEIGNLAQILATKTFEQAKIIWSLRFGGIQLTEGDFEVNLSKDDDHFLKSLSW